jgi:hypothetical protein
MIRDAAAAIATFLPMITVSAARLLDAWLVEIVAA